MALGQRVGAKGVQVKANVDKHTCMREGSLLAPDATGNNPDLELDVGGTLLVNAGLITDPSRVLLRVPAGILMSSV